MENIYIPFRDDVELFMRLEPTETGLIIWLKPELKAIIEQAPIPQHVDQQVQELGFSRFHPYTEAKWGVDGRWQWLTEPSVDGLVGTTSDWAMVMPDNDTFDYGPSQAFSMSMSRLMHLLNYTVEKTDAPTDCRQHQLLFIRYVGGCEGYGMANLGGFITIHGRRVLQQIIQTDRADELHQVVEGAMHRTHQRIAPGSILSQHSQYFRLNVSQGGRFYITVPGDACDIGVDGMVDIEEERGFELGCHNLDTPLQQQSLIAGLAALEHFMWQFVKEHDRVT